MATDLVQVQIRILDKEYNIGCPAEERDALLESARMLNEKMREIRSSGKVVGSERIAVMAAINLAHELLQQRSQGGGGGYSRDLEQRLLSMQERVESALAAEGRQLSL